MNNVIIDHYKENGKNGVFEQIERPVKTCPHRLFEVKEEYSKSKSYFVKFFQLVVSNHNEDTGNKSKHEN